MSNEEEHVLTFRVSKVLHDEIERIAKKEHRSVSGQVRAWLSAAVAAEIADHGASVLRRKGAE
jgi:hypothetical protein